MSESKRFYCVVKSREFVRYTWHVKAISFILALSAIDVALLTLPDQAGAMDACQSAHPADNLSSLILVEKCYKDSNDDNDVIAVYRHILNISMAHQSNDMDRIRHVAAWWAALAFERLGDHDRAVEAITRAAGKEGGQSFDPTRVTTDNGYSRDFVIDFNRVALGEASPLRNAGDAQTTSARISAVPMPSASASPTALPTVPTALDRTLEEMAAKKAAADKAAADKAAADKAAADKAAANKAAADKAAALKAAADQSAADRAVALIAASEVSDDAVNQCIDSHSHAVCLKAFNYYLAKEKTALTLDEVCHATTSAVAVGTMDYVITSDPRDASGAIMLANTVINKCSGTEYETKARLIRDKLSLYLGNGN